MSTRRSLIVGLAFAPLGASAAGPIVAGKTAARIVAIMKTTGKVGATLTVSAVAGVVSAKVMKDIEHAHDDAPAMHVVAYYSLVGNRRVNEASTFWVKPDQRQLDFLRTFDRLELRDLKELSKTPERAAVWVSLYGNQVSRAASPWQGTVYLVWTGSAWMITNTQIGSGAA
jgi:hypothetical protein